MSLVTWSLLGLGVFLAYCAVKGINPWNAFVTRLGIATATPAKLGGQR